MTVGDDGRVNLPYPNGTKERPNPTVPLQEGQRRFYFTAGRKPDLFQPVVQPDSEIAFLVEGETDTMRLWQATEGKVPVFGIGGINTWHSGLADQLAEFKQVYVVLDNDEDYAVKGQVDEAWRKVRHDVRHAKRVTLPHDVKDLCEFFSRYDLDLLRQLTKKMGRSRYSPVDFHLPPPPVRWLLENWIAQGDVTVLSGKGGLGKSLVVQALGMAIIRGDATFLDQAVGVQGRVLLADEENPQDVVYSRMLRFGLDPNQHSGSLRYLWNQHIRLDRDADVLLDEAMEFDAKLVGLDSLTRMHSLDENSNSEMKTLFNDALTPLARDTGAAVVLIHHHDKSASGARGAGDLINAADAAIDVYDDLSRPGCFTMRLVKSRRGIRGREITVAIEDTAGGGLQLVANPPVVIPNF